MNNLFRFFRVWLLTSALILTGSLFAQNVNPNEPVATDPNVKIGKLDNGLVYYIRKNKKPENRVELRLAVNAGSMQESDFQKGLAHFTEHMCFNGTKNFPKNELINYLQKTGIKFGADINAYTSFDETVYMLQIPTDDKTLFEKGFQVIEDWAHNVTFDGKEIDKERGVIIEEWRLGLGADDRMRKKYFPIIFKGSRYADRIPIGDINIIQNFKHDTLRKFYYDWYRPSLQAVVVVGDIDINEVEQKIKEHFSGLKDPEVVKPRIDYDIPDNTEPLIAITSDKEATSSNVMIFFKHPHTPVKTMSDYRQFLINELYTEMLNARLQEYQVKPDAPFVYSYNFYGRFLARNGDAYALMGMMKENQIEQGIELLLTENERVKRYGFLPTELERMKEDLLTRYEKNAKEWDKTQSSALADEYVRHYLEGEPIPGAKNEYRYAKMLLPDITLEEVNSRAAKWITEHNMVAVITLPEKEGIRIPTEEQILKIIKSVKDKEIEPYVDKFKAQPLVDDAELKGSPMAMRKENTEYGFTEITLQNGIKVIIKNTDFKNDEILFSAVSPGGHSLVPDEDYISAMFATQIIDESGLGKFDNTELQKKLKGKTIEISPYIDEIKEGFIGQTNPKDLETLLQLTYLYFTQPRQDAEAFDASISRTKSQMKFIRSNPLYVFIDTLYKVCGSNNPRVIVLPTESQIDKIRLEKVYAIYKDRFANAGDFTFFFVGNIHPDSVMPLLEKYIGSLPVTGRVETWKDVSPKFPDGVTQVKVYKGSEPKSMVGIVLNEPIRWDDTTRLQLRLLKEILTIKVIEVIREEMSGIYSPRIQLQAEKYPKPEYSLVIMFGCSPKNTEKLSKAVFGIIEKIKKNGPTETDLKKAQELLIRERETDLKENRWWKNKIENLYFNGDSIGKLDEFNAQVNKVTTEELKRAANRFFVKDHYVKTVLFPEKKK